MDKYLVIHNIFDTETILCQVSIEWQDRIDFDIHAGEKAYTVFSGMYHIPKKFIDQQEKPELWYDITNSISVTFDKEIIVVVLFDYDERPIATGVYCDPFYDWFVNPNYISCKLDKPIEKLYSIKGTPTSYPLKSKYLLTLTSKLQLHPEKWVCKESERRIEYYNYRDGSEIYVLYHKN